MRGTNIEYTVQFQMSHEWAFAVIVLDLPKYMNDVLHFSIQDNGIYSSIPQLIKLIMAVVTGSLNDWLIAKKHLTITGSRRIFVSIGKRVSHSDGVVEALRWDGREGDSE